MLLYFVSAGTLQPGQLISDTKPGDYFTNMDKKKGSGEVKLPAELWGFSGALVVCPWCESALEGNLRRGEAVEVEVEVEVEVAGGALVGRSWGRAGGRSTALLESFLRVFPLSGVRQERGTLIMGIWSSRLSVVTKILFWSTDVRQTVLCFNRHDSCHHLQHCWTNDSYQKHVSEYFCQFSLK